MNKMADADVAGFLDDWIGGLNSALAAGDELAPLLIQGVGSGLQMHDAVILQLMFWIL